MFYSIQKEIYTQLTIIRDEYASEKFAGMRILIDLKDINDINSQWQTLKDNIRQFPIVCITNDILPFNENIYNLESENVFIANTLALNYFSEKKFFKLVEGNWKVFWNNDTSKPLLIKLCLSDFIALYQDYPKLTVVPFYSISEMDDLLKGKNINFHVLSDKPCDYDNKLIGLQVLKTVTSCLSRLPEVDTHNNSAPRIIYNSYNINKDYARFSRFYQPKDISDASNELLNDGRIMLYGFGSGTDYTGIKLLENISKKKNPIFKIKVYSKAEISQFIDDYEQGELLCTSVVLRDLFDPFMHHIGEGNVYDFSNGDFNKLWNEEDAGIPGEVVKEFIMKDIVFTKLLHAKGKVFNDIISSLNGKNGNFLIITSQFDSKDNLIDYYKKILRNDAYLNDIIEIIKPMYGGNINLNEEIGDLVFNEMLCDIHDAIPNVNFTGEDINEIKLSYQEMSNINKEFRIAYAMMFKTILFNTLDEFTKTRQSWGTGQKKAWKTQTFNLIKKFIENVSHYNEHYNPQRSSI